MIYSVLTPTTFVAVETEEEVCETEFRDAFIFKSGLDEKENNSDMFGNVQSSLLDDGLTATLLDLHMLFENDCVVANHTFNRELTHEEQEIVKASWSGDMSDGWGEVSEQICLGFSDVEISEECDECNGVGYLNDGENEEDECDNCNGSGQWEGTDSSPIVANFHIDDITIQLMK